MFKRIIWFVKAIRGYRKFKSDQAKERETCSALRPFYFFCKDCGNSDSSSNTNIVDEMYLECKKCETYPGNLESIKHLIKYWRSTLRYLIKGENS